jgi:hypothetical protein
LPNKQSQFEQAEKFLMQKKYFQASELLTKCYSQHQNFRTNYLLFKALTKSQQDHAAVDLAQDYLNSYIADNDLFLELLKAMGQDHQYIAMRILYQQLEPCMKDTEQTFFDETILQFEQQADPLWIRKIVFESAGMELVPPSEQRRLLKKIYSLPVKLLVNIAPNILASTTIHPLIKVDLLDTLRKLKINESFDFVFINGEHYQVSPAKLPNEQSSEVKKRLFALLPDHTDQALLVAQQAEISLKLLLLYPFATTIIKVNHGWLDALVKGETAALSISEKEIAVKLTELLDQWA